MEQNWKQMQENIHLSIKQGSSMQEKTVAKISDSIADINKNRGLGFNQNEKYCAQEIGYIVQYLLKS